MLKKILLSILAVITLLIISVGIYYRFFIYKAPLISAEDLAAVTLMPLPAKLEMKSGVLDLSNGLDLMYKGNNDVVQKSIVRFKKQIKEIYQVKETAEGVMLNISCLTPTKSNIPSLGDDESYNINIGDEINLEANTQWGINHGLESILQLISSQSDEPVISKLKMEDQPRFGWRGLMMDVSRHWMPKDVILRVLDAMAAVKMNTFHWHLSDDQGFRVESFVFPGLQEQGSDGKYYTQDEIKEVIAFAAERGIRVIPEFDIPGHSKSWQIAYSELGTDQRQMSLKNTGGEMFSPPLDPTNEKVYEFLDRFIEEMGALFPDPYFHIGGDEVDSKYWDNNERIQTFMHEHNLADAHALQAYFNKRVQPILEKHGKKMVGWQEILHTDLGSDIVTQSWIDQKSLFKAVQSGASGILSAGWYLDLKLHANDYYQVDPLVLPGAVDIEPDSAHWKMYDIKIDFGSNQINGDMVLFDRDPNNVYGFFGLMNNLVAFKSGTIENGLLKLELTAQMGKLKFEANLEADSLNGKISMMLMNSNCSGKLVGSSELPGTTLPKIEVIKPLTTEEQTRILGGESAMWAETVSKNNVESRVWPSSAAIAEKLWSPAELTANTEDMYRRLLSTSDFLDKRGAQHQKQMNAILENLIAPEGLAALTRLTSLLEEVKYYGRLSKIMKEKNLYLPDLQLDGVVDAVRPESFEARKFNQQVDKFISDPSDINRTAIMDYLIEWSQLNNELKPHFNSPQLEKVAKISSVFSEVSQSLLQRFEDDNVFSEEEKQILSDKITFLENGENGMVLAVAPGLRKLLNF
ncbi:MAG TPA: beta-N-acetylhexosaminidase [Draconibacterium sp.]|nr:beta-N-acetylhexosaminidase [Draconibacterium sp.]